MLLLTKPLAMLFMPANATNIDVILKTTKELNLLLNTTYFLLGVVSVLSGALRGLGYSIVQMILYTIGICGTRVVWIYTVFPTLNSPVGLMLCYPASWIVCLILLGTSRILAEKKLKKITAPTES